MKSLFVVSATAVITFDASSNTGSQPAFLCSASPHMAACATVSCPLSKSSSRRNRILVLHPRGRQCSQIECQFQIASVPAHARLSKPPNPHAPTCQSAQTRHGLPCRRLPLTELPGESLQQPMGVTAASQFHDPAIRLRHRVGIGNIARRQFRRRSIKRPAPAWPFLRGHRVHPLDTRLPTVDANHRRIQYPAQPAALHRTHRRERSRTFAMLRQ